jgi:hypothetical protein
MKRILIVALCVGLLPGCLATLGLSSGNTLPSATQPSVGPGGSFSSGGVNARVSECPVAGALLGIGILSYLFGRGERADMRPVPDLDLNRTVHLQDCTQAITNPTANLRCR